MARAKLTLSRSAVLSNYRILSRKVPELDLLPMVKADAYGHGANFVAESLLGEKKLHGFGVATFAEGIALRDCIKKPNLPIIVFSDAAPWTEEHAKICMEYKLEPVFSEILSLLTFQASRMRAGFQAKINAHIEVNTGMNRLGIPLQSLQLVSFAPKSVFTHLADADLPKAAVTKKQMDGLADLIQIARSRFPHALLHFSNSSAIWNADHFPLTKEMDLARPGLSLYGIRPFAKAKEDGLKRVMRFTAPIINRIHLQYGDQVGYGATYTCKKRSGEWIAILAAGYGDGLFRSLSGSGIATLGKQKFTLVGRVSMDLSAIHGNSQLKVGDELELWGNSIDPYTQAALAETIPYELTTRIGSRLERFLEK